MIQKRSTKTLAFLLSLILCMGMLLSIPASAASVSDFSDVKSDSWYYDSVSYVVSKGLFQGLTSTSFGPNGSMTRGMFVTVLGRYAGAKADSWCAAKVNGSDVNIRSDAGTSYSSLGLLSKGTSVTIKGEKNGWYYISAGSKNGYVLAQYITPTYHHFTDVTYGQYYAGYAVWAYEKGYVSGTSDSSTFSPNSKITREQICKILYSYAQNNGYTLPTVNDAMDFSDASSIHSWAVEPINALQRAGVINGYDDQTIKPTKTATRAEVAKILYLFIQALGESDSGDETEDEDEPSGGVPISDKTVSVYHRIRVALYAASKSDLRTQTSKVKLSTDGDGFEYGYMDSDRDFVSEGELDASTITVTTDGTTFTVKNSSGKVILKQDDELALHPTGSHPLTCIDDGNRYYGDFNCLNAVGFAGKITFVNYVDMDDYVKGVLPFEFIRTWPSETLKAGAIAIRSYAMRYIENSVYKPYGFDLDNSTRTQVYNGRSTCSESYFQNTDAAVDATSNMYLTYNGSVAHCMFSSSNGGQTYALSGFDYLVSKEDPYDEEQGNGKYGHGIGLSQWGSYIMGYSYEMNYTEILEFYYPGTSIRYGA